MGLDQLNRRLGRLRQVASHMDSHLASPLRLEELADIAHLSRFHFERAFADYAGETPLARVRRLRLAEARRRLESGQVDSLVQLGLESGYGNPCAFSRAFRQAYAMAPSAVRPCRDVSPSPLRRVQLAAIPILYVPFAGPLDESLEPFDELRARALLQGIPRERRKGWSVHLEGGLGDWQGKVNLQAALLAEPLGVSIPGLARGVLPAGDYVELTLTGGYDAPSREALASRVEQEIGACLRDGPVLRRFRNTDYLPARHERRCSLYVPVSHP